MSLNKVMLIGNVGADPEVRYHENSNTKSARIRIATSERYTDKNGETRENTEWHTVNCWRKLADTVEKFVKKGSQIYVEGSLRTREWTDNAGVKRNSTEIEAVSIQLLGKRSDSAQPSSAANGGYAAHSTPVSGGPGGYQPPYQPATKTDTPVDNNQAMGTSASNFVGDMNDDMPF